MYLFEDLVFGDEKQAHDRKKTDSLIHLVALRLVPLQKLGMVHANRLCANCTAIVASPDLTRKAALKAAFKMKTEQGEILSGFDMKMIESGPVQKKGYQVGHLQSSD